METALLNISMYDDRNLRADITCESTAAGYWYVRRSLEQLPEVKWHAAGFWTFPVTEPNLDALQKLEAHYYTLDAAAQTFYEYATLTIQLAKAREKRRWKYLFDDTSIHFTTEVTETGALHTVSEDGGETRSYALSRESFRHQVSALDALHGQEFFALFMDMGTGKTKCIIDELALSARAKPGLTALIVCPKTILGTWRSELKKWLPADINVVTERLRTGVDGMEDLIRWVQKPGDLKIIFTNYERLAPMARALQTIKFKVMVCDESTHLKNPAANRTKAALAIAPTTGRRFILTGSPVANSVFDFYPQFEFLSPGILGYSTLYAFKNHYANIVKIRSWEEVQGYRNLDELKRRVARHAFIVKKSQCLDLPEKLYQTRTIPMGKAQRKAYDQMVEWFMAELVRESGESGTIEARGALAKMMRLSQITQGFGRDIENNAYFNIMDGDGKLKELLRIIIEELPENDKVIIWARFQHDVQRVSAELDKLGLKYLILTGSTPQATRDTIEDTFNNGPSRILIGEPGTGGLGLTLLGNKEHPCRTVIYYSNDYSLLKRVQSEDRCHRIGQSDKVLYIDLVCGGSIDEHIVATLQNKRDLSEAMKDMQSIRALLLGNRIDLDENGDNHE